MKTKSLKHISSFILVLAIAALFAIPSMAADTTATGIGTVSGDVTINGSIEALIISVTHPLTVEYAINPNSETNNAFTAPDIEIKNLTKCPVNVTVSSLKAISGGTLTLTDVEPESKSWSKLNTADSKEYIALGIKAKNSNGWGTGYSLQTHYAVKETASLIGSLANNDIGVLELTADFGLAFDGAYTAKHSLVLLFNLV